MIDADQKKALLDLARKTLKTYLTEKSIPSYQPPDEGLAERKGAFVSLHNGEELRGCIGQLFADRELYKIVQHCAISAALEDTRFIAVTSDELNELKIEISVLSPFRRIRQIEEIEVGKHGLYIVQGQFRGLLLPQVATQYGWDRVAFLRHTCRKSGLPESAWQDPHTIIHIFEAEVFSE
jgi:AmmeMemoRadiSam system protein A